MQVSVRVRECADTAMILDDFLSQNVPIFDQTIYK